MNLEAMFPGGAWDAKHSKFVVRKGRYDWPAAVVDDEGGIVLTDFGKRFAKPVSESPVQRPILGLPSSKRNRR